MIKIELAIIGGSEFVMGFQLIGVKRTYEAESKDMIKEAFTAALRDRTLGIIVTSDKTMQKLDPHFKSVVENSITPVVVVLSTSATTQDNIRDLVKKAIGIDLLARG